MIDKYKLYLEKVGYNQVVEEFANTIVNFITQKFEELRKKPIKKFVKDLFTSKKKFQFPVSDIPPKLVNDQKVVKFTIIIHDEPFEKNQMNVIKTTYENGNITYECILDLSPDNNWQIRYTTVAHEIMHLYQYTRTSFNKSIEKSTYYDMKGLKSFYKDMDYSIFNDHIYRSLDEEIASRVQEAGAELMFSGTTKDTFYRDLKRTEYYEYAEDLEKCDIVDKILREHKEREFVSKWLFLYYRKDYLQYKNKISKLNIFNRLRDKFLRHIGPIESPKLSDYYIFRNFFYTKLSEQECLDFLLDYKKFIQSKGKKFKRKLLKLYDLFE